MTARQALPIDYADVAHMVDRWVPEWQQIKFDGVVAIARGGLVAGVMASSALSLPLYAVGYNRESREVSWYSSTLPPLGSKLLLIEDIAGRGTTLFDSIDFLTRRYEIEVCTLVSDDFSRCAPRWSNFIPKGHRAWFPWEREVITDQFATTNNMPSQPEFTYCSWAIDLDGVLLPDLADEDYQRNLEETLSRRDAMLPAPVLPKLDLSTVTIITGRPEMDRARTRLWLDQHGFLGELVMRNNDEFAVEFTAEYKAHYLHKRSHTHFLESCPKQSIKIAKAAPVAKVFWWAGDGSVHLVKAAVADLDYS